jgi:hypothetical protein
MDDNRLTTIMNELHNRFIKEITNMDPQNPKSKCDTTFLKKYTKLYDEF